MRNSYKVEIDFAHLELITIASMCYCARSWEKDKHNDPTYTAFMKISAACWPLLTKDEQALLKKTLKSLFNEPSIERGMVQGGMEALMERLDDELFKNNNDASENE